MKIKCSRDSKWNADNGGSGSTYRQGQVLVVGEDVSEQRAEEMLKFDYAEKVTSPIVKETKEEKRNRKGGSK